MVNWSKHAKRTLPFNCRSTTQDKTKARKVQRRVRRILIIGKARRCVRHVLIMSKARRREGAHSAQFSRLVVSYLSQTSFKYFNKFNAKKVPLQFECSFFTLNEVSLFC